MVNDDSRRERRFTRDRETIRNWADRHDLVPVRDAGGREDRYRMAPEGRLDDTHERAEWNRFFEDFESGDRVVVYHGEGSTEPLEVTDREGVVMDLDDDEVEERLLEGETVRSTVTETAVVESVVTEELTVESELVDRETVDQRVVDTRLESREATDVRLVDTGRDADADRFDVDRYLEAVGGSSASAPGGGATTFEGGALSYDAEIDVEERWTVTRELTERNVVESEIVGAEVTEADSLEDYDLDVEGLHRTIAESGIIEADLSTEEFLTHHDAESELTEQDRVTTSFTRQRTVEDEVIDRTEVHGDLTGGEVRDMELVSTGETVHGAGDRDVEATASSGSGDRAAGTAAGGTDTGRSTGTSTETRSGESTGTSPGVESSGATDAGPGAETGEPTGTSPGTDAGRPTGTTAGTDTGGSTGRTAGTDSERPTGSGDGPGEAGSSIGGGAALNEDDVGKTVVDPTGDRIGTVTGVDASANAMYVDPNPGLTDRIKSAIGWGGGAGDDPRLDGKHVDYITDDEIRLDHREDLESRGSR